MFTIMNMGHTWYNNLVRKVHTFTYSTLCRGVTYTMRGIIFSKRVTVMVYRKGVTDHTGYHLQ